MNMTDLLFLDTETTGLTPGHNEILSIYAMRVNYSNESPIIVATCGAYFMPEFDNRINQEALNVNGWRREDAIPKVVTWESFFPVLQCLTSKCKVVGHNIDFDLRMIQGMNNMFLNHLRYMIFDKLDTLKYARSLVKDVEHKTGRKSYSQENLCQYFGIKNEKSHSAKGDVRALFQLYTELKKLDNNEKQNSLF